MRKKISSNKQLDLAIIELKIQKDRDFQALKLQLAESYEEFKPSNIVKRVFVDLKEEPQVRDNVLQSVVSLAAGYLTKRLLIGKSNSFLKSVVGYVIQIGATKLISKKVVTNNK